MVDLALSVLCSSLIFVVFKFFGTYRVRTLHAIVVNYVVACCCGLCFSSTPFHFYGLLATPWFWRTLMLGMLFIIIFNAIALASQRNGVGVTAVATKMSLVVPVLFAVVYYRDTPSAWQLVGIGLALAAVYMASIKKNSTRTTVKNLGLPLIVFLGSGLIDTAINYIRDAFLTAAEYPLFSATVFGAAACGGLIFIVLNGKKRAEGNIIRDLCAGITLGIPNYFSIFFLLRALQHPSYSSSAIFTVNNVAIVLFTALLGMLLFKERPSAKNYLGLLLAIFSIILVALY
ncbi:MAG: DMT family transporter [Bacteroidota bacterium]